MCCSCELTRQRGGHSSYGVVADLSAVDTETLDDDPLYAEQVSSFLYKKNPPSWARVEQPFAIASH